MESSKGANQKEQINTPTLIVAEPTFSTKTTEPYHRPEP